MKGPPFTTLVFVVTIVEAALCLHVSSIPVASLTSARHKHAETKRLFHSTKILNFARATPEKIIIPTDRHSVNTIKEAQTEALFQKSETMNTELINNINGNDRKLKVINGGSWKSTNVNSDDLIKNVAKVHIRNGNLNVLTRNVPEVHIRSGNRDVLTKDIVNVHVRSVDSNDQLHALCHTAECIKALDEYLKWRNENGYPLQPGRWGK